MTQDDLKAFEEILKASYKKSKTGQNGEIYFFIVSVERYKREAELSGNRQEADKFFKIFSQHIEIKRKNIYSLFNENATKINIISQLRNFEKLLNEKDQLIVYFSGHGYSTEFSNFFIPYDGNRDNFISCIPNQYIARSLSSCLSESVILNFDFAFDSTYETTTSESNYPIPYKGIGEKLDSVYKHIELAESFFDYISVTEPGRKKESFLFRKYHADQKTATTQKEPSNGYSERPMYRILLNKFNELIKEVENDNTLRVLNYLRLILQNNDENLLEKVEVLKAKLQEINRPSKAKHKDIVNEKQVINKITCEFIKQIKQNGFYLVHSPKIEKSIQDRIKKRIKILFTSANPRNTNFLRLRAEAESIEYELLKSRYRDEFEFKRISSLDISQLQDSLLNDPPNILHFSGHGTCEGIAVLNDEDEVSIVKSHPLGNLFKLFSDDLQCIFLNSCHSVSQSEEIRKYVNSVICMNKEVADEAAILFCD